MENNKLILKIENKMIFKIENKMIFKIENNKLISKIENNKLIFKIVNSNNNVEGLSINLICQMLIFFRQGLQCHFTVLTFLPSFTIFSLKNILQKKYY